MNIEHPVPLEQEDRELGEALKRIAQGTHPTVKSVVIGSNFRLITYKDGRRKFRETDRNEPCGCGSGRKYKKCCLQLRQAA